MPTKITPPQLLALWLAVAGGLGILFSGVVGLNDARRAEKDPLHSPSRVVEVPLNAHGNVVVEYNVDGTPRRSLLAAPRYVRVGDEFEVYYSAADPTLAFGGHPSEVAEGRFRAVLLLSLFGSLGLVALFVARVKPEIPRLNRAWLPREYYIAIAAATMPLELHQLLWVASTAIACGGAVLTMVSICVLLCLGIGEEWGWRRTLRSMAFWVGAGLFIVGATAPVLTAR